MKNGILRALATGIHFMVFGCSAIVVGMVSYFINKYPHDTHIVYEEVIVSNLSGVPGARAPTDGPSQACITLGVYTFGMILPFIKAYRGYLVPLNLVMSYLWITSFIFASEDWSAGRCAWTGPGAGHCNIKRAIAAFTFLTM